MAQDIVVTLLFIRATWYVADIKCDRFKRIEE